VTQTMSSDNESLTLKNFLGDCQFRVNQALKTLLDPPQPSDRLRQAMAYASLNGGKRVRPVLVYGAALALEGSLDQADPAACAVELIHSYSLAHDDLPAMDDDDLRRGKPSLHKAFDEATAILAGDALQGLAFRVLSIPSPEQPAAMQSAMVHCLAEAAGESGMVGGQALDLESVGRAAECSDLETVHRLKTGALIRASVVLGSLSAATGSPGQIQCLSNFADCIGLAFQVQDDILDETTDTKDLGKPRGSDHARDKPTYVNLLGLDGARRKAAQLTDQAIGNLDGFSASADRLRELAVYITSRRH